MLAAAIRKSPGLSTGKAAGTLWKQSSTNIESRTVLAFECFANLGRQSLTSFIKWIQIHGRSGFLDLLPWNNTLKHY